MFRNIFHNGGLLICIFSYPFSLLFFWLNSYRSRLFRLCALYGLRTLLFNVSHLLVLIDFQISICIEAHCGIWYGYWRRNILNWYKHVIRRNGRRRRRNINILLKIVVVIVHGIGVSEIIMLRLSNYFIFVERRKWCKGIPIIRIHLLGNKLSLIIWRSLLFQYWWMKVIIIRLLRQWWLLWVRLLRKIL